MLMLLKEISNLVGKQWVTLANELLSYNLTEVSTEDLGIGLMLAIKLPMYYSGLALKDRER